MSSELVVSITETIAVAKGVNPRDLDFTFKEFIPEDAIRTLAAQEEAPWTLRFDIPEHVVTVTSDGLIFVDRLQTIPSPENCRRFTNPEFLDGAYPHEI